MRQLFRRLAIETTVPYVRDHRDHPFENLEIRYCSRVTIERGAGFYKKNSEPIEILQKHIASRILFSFCLETIKAEYEINQTNRYFKIYLIYSRFY